MKRSRSNQPPLSLFSFQDIITSVTGVIMFMTLFLAVELTTRKVTSQQSSSREVVEELQQAIAVAEKRLPEIRSKLVALSSLNTEVGMYTQRSANAERDAVAEEIALLQEKTEELRKQDQSLDDSVAALETVWANRITDINQLEDLRQRKSAIEAEVTDLKNSHRVFYSNSDESGRQVLLVELFDSDILVAEAGQKKPPLRFSGQFSKQSFLEWASGQQPSRFRFVLVVHPGTTRLFQELRDELREKGFSTGFDLLPEHKVAIDVDRGAG